MNYTKLAPVLVSAIQQQQKQIEELKKENDVSCQNARVNSTKNRVMKNQKTLSCSFNLNRKNN